MYWIDSGQLELTCQNRDLDCEFQWVQKHFFLTLII
jgi:hypothetical protein